jgi:uncharacterized membrane protein
VDTATDATTTHGGTSTGLDANIASVLLYVLWLITGVVFPIVENENEFVRFHAMQCVVLSVAGIVVGLVFSAFTLAVGVIPILGGPLAWVIGLISRLVSLVFFTGWLFAMYKAYQNEAYELPVVGGITRRLTD